MFKYQPLSPDGIVDAGFLSEPLEVISRFLPPMWSNYWIRELRF